MIALLLFAALQPGGDATTTDSAHAPILRNPQPVVRYTDYPDQSLRNGEAGIVSLLLHVSPQGRATSCDVTETSGFPHLDAGTCQLFKARARFNPATDAQGAPTTGFYRSVVAWGVGDDQPRIGETVPLYVSALPERYEQPVTMELLFDKSGHGTQCTVKTSSGNGGADRAACAYLTKNYSITPPKSRSADVEPAAVRYITASFEVK